MYACTMLLQIVTKLGAGKVLQPQDLLLDATGMFFYAGTSNGWIKKVFFVDKSVEDLEARGRAAARPRARAPQRGHCLRSGARIIEGAKSLEILALSSTPASFLLLMSL